MLPVVDGLTETSASAEPLYERLATFLAQQPGASRDDIGEAISKLESAAKREGNERMRTRISAALTLLRGDAADEKDKGY